jgi:putative FmdB family regulatory protein
MPIYEYQCTACDHQLEKLQRVSDTDLRDCPQCNRSTLQRLVSLSSFKLKGTGWYVTDFKNNEDKKEAVKTDTPQTETATTADSKSEAKTSTSDSAAKPVEKKASSSTTQVETASA